MKTTPQQFGIGVLLLMLLLGLATGCKNTASGAGKDIENMGEKIQEKTD